MAATLDWAEYAARSFEPRPDADRWPTPGALAKVVEPDTMQTAALDLVDEAVAWAYSTPDSRLIVSMPPQEGKSQRVTKTGSLWALHRNRDLKIGIVSYNKPLAESFGRDIRNWVTTYNGEEGSLDLGLRIARDNGAASRWQLAGHRGGVICVGLKGSLTGRRVDALVIDDPFADKEQADSAYYRDRVWGWWQSVGSTRLSSGASVIVILTRWHEDDLAGRLIAAEDGSRWRVINIPALADHDPAKGQTDALGRSPGEWLKSARGRTTAQWEAIRITAGTRVFNALYQGRPSPDSGDVWQRQWWRRYSVPLWSQHPTVPGAYRVEESDGLIMSWDMAFKDTKSSDFVVGQVWARRGANVYLLDQVRKRLTFTETLTAFKAMVARWPQATAKLVEDKANGTAVINTLKSKIPGIVEVTPTESKYARANAVAPVIEAGNVFLPTGEIALFEPDELVNEAAEFPNGAHDDQVDATSQALAQLLLDGTGAQAWIDYVNRLAANAAEARARAAEPYQPQAHAASSLPEAESIDETGSTAPTAESEDPVALRKRLRDQAFRNQNR
ncbi:phage terminase large subunit [Streptomyces sp. NPDC092369]|uniref:phage terminase large subunit n=1 Tax=Streptomyces sp. NPDC092369 TaxID=3366015 RepID=UPI0038187E26